MHHAYHNVWDMDGDYIVFASWNGERWIEHTRWMIPGTQIED